MSHPLKELLSYYDIQDAQTGATALKEIIQKIVLLGLWREKFFEHAAFYGGTALRLLYGLPRFSEDLDFSLLETNQQFSLEKYFSAIHRELSAYGLQIEIINKPKHSAVDSAFVKANTAQHLLQAELSDNLIKSIHRNQLIKVKFEVDTNPPARFMTESKFLLDPIPFSVVTYTADNLFAGKMHAILCRSWQDRVKGRDWYDLIWFVRKGIVLNLKHLTERLKQSGHYDLSSNVVLSTAKFQTLLKKRISEIDFSKAKLDVAPFIRNQNELDGWSLDFFLEIATKIKTTGD